MTKPSTTLPSGMVARILLQPFSVPSTSSLVPSGSLAMTAPVPGFRRTLRFLPPVVTSFMGAGVGVGAGVGSGVAVGAAVGSSVGTAVGSSVGSAVGSSTGVYDGQGSTGSGAL